MSVPAGAATVGRLLDESRRRLEAAGVPDPGREAVALVALALGTDRGGVLARKPDPVAEAEAERLDTLVAARVRRVPLQYLAGAVEFHGLRIVVGSGVLIPRPETEDLVDAVLALPLSADARVADLGTGSGCIAAALAAARREWRVTAIDRSPEALAIAASNLPQRVHLVQRDFAKVPEPERGVYDVVVSNPPYVSEAEWKDLEPEVRDHEPRAALVPGPGGDEAYRAVAQASSSLLKPEGWLALELGFASASAASGHVAGAGFVDIEVRPDLRGIPRILLARRPR
ncbi:MAG TPA: peptide chain release factor N(5)-glutamine methyltransferase [Candidatus Polarisedimenticolaceae bacterium]|nr:peptide chain release factor N(5)-glutamine methyltransferase [Candidatus Polarisedimenticolaceae bacterium]